MYIGGINILRVIAGAAKGHKLKTLNSNLTRPTTDKVKGALFNIIAAYIEDSDVIDVFAGSGSLGIEALSRGAKSAVFIDMNPDSITIIKDNLKHVKMEDKAEVIKGDSVSMLNRFSGGDRKFDLIFLDPPYGKNLIELSLKSIIKNDIMKKDGIIVAERAAEDIIPEQIEYVKLIRNQKYGDTVLSFYRYIE